MTPQYPHGLRLCPIASGSSGNCTYIGAGGTHILIDAGISAKRILRGLAEIGVRIDDISAVLITHEHSDHITGLPVLLRNKRIPIIATPGTLSGIAGSRYAPPAYPKELFTHLTKNSKITLGDLELISFATSHDSNEPCAYRIHYGGSSVAVITDLGCYDEDTVDHLRGVNLMILESNHDVNMLLHGRYPYPLKMRVLSDTGHLSNENAAKLIAKLYHDKMTGVILGHLSKDNNLAELAYETVRTELIMSEKEIREDFDIVVASRDSRSKLFVIE